MDVKRILRVLIIFLTGMSFALTVACGDPEEATGDDAGFNLGEEDADVAEEDDGGEEEDGGEDVDGGGEEEEEGVIDLAPAPDNCSSTPKPDRCDEDPNDPGFEFAPASLITELAIADESCCFDFNGNGSNDNSLPAILNFASSVEEVNATLAESIADGTITIVLEHNGLDGDSPLADGDEFDIGFLLAENAGASSEEGVFEEGTYIDPLAFEEGGHPQAELPNAVLEAVGDDLRVTAGPGTVIINLELFDTELELVIRNALIEGYVVAHADGVAGGVHIEDGILGGVILFTDLAEAINKVATTCDCLDNPDQILDTTDNNVSCILEEGAGSTCEDEICSSLGEYCSIIEFAPTLIPFDINTANDGGGYSIGMNFSAEATVILGMVDAMPEPFCTVENEPTTCDTEGELCDEATNSCIEADCTVDSHCADAETCVDNACE